MLTNFFGNRGFNDFYDNSAPYVQVRESDTSALIELEVPRYRSEELSVDCDESRGILTVTGRRTSQHHHADYVNLVYASSPLGNFRRSFLLSPELYDVAKHSTKLEAGIFTVIVPKVPRPTAVQVFGGDSKGQLTKSTTPEEFKAVRATAWPPVIRNEDTAEAMTYKCELPPTVTKDHIGLELNGQHLTLSIGYEYTLSSKDRTESQSLSYSTTLGVPRGTTAADISTGLNNGVLTITLAKHQSVPVIEGKK